MPGSALRGVDLNLLVVLEALLRTCSVTAAARELGLSQSAVSHSLANLRRLLGDPLLVRSRNQMLPTAKGHSLLAPTQELLFEVERLVTPGSGFPPGLLRRVFRVLSTDYPQLLMLLPLAKRLAAHAPEATLDLHYLTTLLPDRELDNGAVDVCIAHMPFDLPTRLRRQTLFNDRLVVIARSGHPEIRLGLTMERYAKLGHVGFLSRGIPMFQAMVEKNPAVHREKRVSVANMGLVPRLVATSNYIATLSNRCALQFQERFPLEIHECPFEVKLFPVEMIWHQRDDADEAHTWLRQTLTEIGAEVERQPLGLPTRRGASARREQTPVGADEPAR